MHRFLNALALLGLLAGSAWGVSGSSLALRSTGSSPMAGDWTVDRDGYVGTYIQVAQQGDVTITVNASGTSASGIDPHMSIVLADTKAGFDVAGGFNNYQH